MGLKTIAEYVESDALRQRLVDMGVDYIQGFAVEMPQPFAPDLGGSAVAPSPPYGSGR
jgi:EAL domain-containing protein (putative c-di-GMP-specific phosphodiesterase class I)